MLHGPGGGPAYPAAFGVALGAGVIESSAEGDRLLSLSPCALESLCAGPGDGASLQGFDAQA
jgi:hypothetical protein